VFEAGGKKEKVRCPLRGKEKTPVVVLGEGGDASEKRERTLALEGGKEGREESSLWRRASLPLSCNERRGPLHKKGVAVLTLGKEREGHVMQLQPLAGEGRGGGALFKWKENGDATEPLRREGG